VQILEAFHHPYYNNGRSRIQNEMYQEMEKWLRGLEGGVSGQIIQALTKVEVLHRLQNVGFAS